MRKALYILGDLAEEDVLFMANAGQVIELSRGQALISIGKIPQAVYFVTQGGLAVQLSNGQTVANLGVGDVVGEMSFVEKQAPNANVVATENSRILAVPRAAIDAQLANMPAFAGRFYKALATFLSDRLRTTTATMHGETNTDIDERLLDMIHVAGDRMVRLIGLMDSHATKPR